MTFDAHLLQINVQGFPELLGQRVEVGQGLEKHLVVRVGDEVVQHSVDHSHDVVQLVRPLAEYLHQAARVGLEEVVQDHLVDYRVQPEVLSLCKESRRGGRFKKSSSSRLKSVVLQGYTRIDTVDYGCDNG